MWKELVRQDNGALSSNIRYGAPLERGELDLSYSTDMAILWIEKQVLLVEGIIPTGIMARSQVTFDMALRWSAGIWIYRILLTWRSSGSKNRCYLWKELVRQG